MLLFFNLENGQPSAERAVIEWREAQKLVGLQSPGYLVGFSRGDGRPALATAGSGRGVAEAGGQKSTGVRWATDQVGPDSSAAASPATIEIYSIADQKRLQTIAFPPVAEILCLSDANRRVFCASQTKVYCLSPVPFAHQMENMLTTGGVAAVSEVLDLLNQTYDIDDPDREPQLHKFYKKAGWLFFGDLKFVEAFGHFSLAFAQRGESTPERILSDLVTYWSAAYYQSGGTLGSSGGGASGGALASASSFGGDFVFSAERRQVGLEGGVQPGGAGKTEDIRSFIRRRQRELGTDAGTILKWSFVYWNSAFCDVFLIFVPRARCPEAFLRESRSYRIFTPLLRKFRGGVHERAAFGERGDGEVLDASTARAAAEARRGVALFAQR